MVNGDDRGQLLLLAALIVAATILGSIALLNSIHESPEIATQQDSRSLQETEWVTDQTGTNLERLFRYVTSVEDADIPLPYANKSAFEDAVEDYDEQFLNLSTVSSAGLVTVSYNDSASRTGGIAHGRVLDGRSPPDTPLWVLFQADAVPRLSLNLTSGISPTSSQYVLVEFNESRTASDPTVGLNITGDGSGSTVVQFENPVGSSSPEWTCNVGGPNQLQIDLRAGSAVIQGDTGKYCERGPVELPDNMYIRIVNGGANPRGNFTISGVSSGGSDLPRRKGNPNADAWYREEINSNDILVDPVFDIVYESPEVSYEGEYTLYGGDG